jgi:hypothetical protein
MIRSTTAPTVRPMETTTSIPKTVTTPVPKFPRR